MCGPLPRIRLLAVPLLARGGGPCVPSQRAVHLPGMTCNALLVPPFPGYACLLCLCCKRQREPLLARCGAAQRVVCY